MTHQTVGGHEAGAVFRRTGPFDVVELGEEPADEDAQSYRGAGEAAAFSEVCARPDMRWGWKPSCHAATERCAIVAASNVRARAISSWV